MNVVPRQMLRRIVAKYGNDLGGNARRCEALLKDLCGEYRREINVLTNAIEERIPLDLLAAGNSMPPELLLNRLAKRLEDNLSLTNEAAQWAVNSWALALGVVGESEIEARERKQKLDSPTRAPGEQSPQHPKIHQSPSQNHAPKSAQKPSQAAPPAQPQRSPQIYPPFSQTPARALLENCNIYDNADAGVAVQGESVVAVRRCNIHRNGKVAVRVKENSHARVEDSDLRGNNIAAWESEYGVIIERKNNRD